MPRSSKKKQDVGHTDRRVTVRTDTEFLPSPTLDPLEEAAIKKELENYQQRRKLGEPKPKEVSWADWKCKPEMTPQHFMMAQMYAMGMKPGEIAFELNVNATTVSHILRNTLTKAYVKKLQEYFTRDSKRRFERLVPNAVTCYEEVLSPTSQESTKLKVDVAGRVMDRAWGRAQNDVQDAGNTVLNLIRGLKDLNDSAHRDPVEQAIPVSGTVSSFVDPKAPAPFNGDAEDQQIDDGSVAGLLNSWEEGNNEDSEKENDEEESVDESEEE
jgi:hypothetical protein